jgi:hypothetical protein
MHRTTPIELPRGLILAASIWLVASWIASMGLRTPLQPSSASYTPGVRMMLMCVVIGLTIGWPLLRLSQSVPRFPLRQVLLDLLVLLALVQIVLWPLRLVTPWSPARTLAIDATIAGWAALAGAFVAAGVTSTRPGPRALTMLSCLALVLLGPALAWVGVMTGRNWLPFIELSPLMAVGTLTQMNAPPPAQQWIHIYTLIAAAGLAWTGLGVWSILRTRATGIQAAETVG